jgi:hypothetical protein
VAGGFDALPSSNFSLSDLDASQSPLRRAFDAINEVIAQAGICLHPTTMEQLERYAQAAPMPLLAR